MKLSIDRNVRTFCKILAAALLVLGVAAVWNPPAALAQDAAPAAAEGGAEAKPKTKSFWEMAKHGGPTLVVLIGCSIYTLTLCIERFMFYRKAQGEAITVLARVKAATNLDEAAAALQGAPGVVGRVLRTTVDYVRQGYTMEQTEKLMEGEMTRELIPMEKFLPQLDSMVTMCPLIGLLGTTVGMIGSFSVVAAVGMSKPEMLAGGISEALINTATGLAVAIPALFAFNYFTGKKEAILMDLEKGMSELQVLLPMLMGQPAHAAAAAPQAYAPAPSASQQIQYAYTPQAQ